MFLESVIKISTENEEGWYKWHLISIDISTTKLLQLIIKETYRTPLKIYKYITNNLFTWKQ